MRIKLQNLVNSAVLAGALDGKAVLTRLLSDTAAEPSGPELVYLDFSGIEVATASFLRESILAFRDIVRGRRSQFYPVVANANAVVRDELVDLLRSRGDVLMSCELAEDGAVRESLLLGELDPKQRMTFDLVREKGDTDAGALMRDYGESEGLKHSTAWNNRLAALAALGVVIEQSQGRAKRYRPLFTGM